MVDDVMFSHHGAIGAKSKKRYVSSNQPDGGTEVEAVVYDSRLYRDALRVSLARHVLWCDAGSSIRPSITHALCQNG